MCGFVSWLANFESSGCVWFVLKRACSIDISITKCLKCLSHLSVFFLNPIIFLPSNTVSLWCKYFSHTAMSSRIQEKIPALHALRVKTKDIHMLFLPGGVRRSAGAGMCCWSEWDAVDKAPSRGAGTQKVLNKWGLFLPGELVEGVGSGASWGTQCQDPSRRTAGSVACDHSWEQCFMETGA